MNHVQTKHNLRPLVAPLAEYVSSVGDPQRAIAEIMAFLVKEVVAINVEAYRQVTKKD